MIGQLFLQLLCINIFFCNRQWERYCCFCMFSTMSIWHCMTTKINGLNTTRVNMKQYEFILENVWSGKIARTHFFLRYNIRLEIFMNSLLNSFRLAVLEGIKEHRPQRTARAKWLYSTLSYAFSQLLSFSQTFFTR